MIIYMFQALLSTEPEWARLKVMLREVILREVILREVILRADV
jgi:hypothetical protein